MAYVADVEKLVACVFQISRDNTKWRPGILVKGPGVVIDLKKGQVFNVVYSVETFPEDFSIGVKALTKDLDSICKVKNLI